jgi:hypothetical protein
MSATECRYIAPLLWMLFSKNQLLSLFHNVAMVASILMFLSDYYGMGGIV